MNKQVKKDIAITAVLLVLLLAISFVSEGDYRDRVNSWEYYHGEH